jgi:mRNA interferase MazF
VVLSRHGFNTQGHTVMAMITDQRNVPRMLDVSIDHLAVGLRMPSVVRMKFFTLDNRPVLRRIGRLAEADRQELLKNLRQILPAGWKAGGSTNQ